MKTKRSKEGWSRAGMIMLAHHLKMEEGMNEKLVTNRRAGWWIIAALCGLLAAAFVVGEAKAGSLSAKERELYEHLRDESWEAGGWETHDGFPICGIPGDPPSFRRIVKFFKWSLKTQWYHFPPEIIREMNWICLKFEMGYPTIEEQRAVYHAWLKYRDIARDAWFLFDRTTRYYLQYD